VIRGEFVSSDSLSRVSLHAELLFIRLILVADDYGRVDGRLPKLRADLFPMRETVRAADLERWLNELATADGVTGPLQRYEVEHRPYLQLLNWETHRGKGQRAATSRFPAPPAGDPRIPEDVPGISGDPPEGRGTRDEGRGTRRAGARARGAQTDPPQSLAIDALRSLQAWAAAEHAELQADVPELAAACLDHFRGKGERRVDWISTCRTWIRNEARFAAQRGRNGTPGGRKPYSLADTAEQVLAAIRTRGMAP
jgi:hypothetical protein